MRLNHNALAYTANNNLNTINNNLTKSMERLSSGYKINKSSDDPAAKAISQRMKAQIRGLDRATDNANDGISVIQTAEGGLDEVHSILQRMRELAVQAANDTFDEADRDAIQAEIDQLEDELDRVSDTTEFNGRKLLNGELNKKGYVDPANSDKVSIFEIGGDIDPGEYGIKITSNGTQAEDVMSILGAGVTITKEQAGAVTINGLSVAITEGMTGDEVNERIRDAASKVGVDLDLTSGKLSTQEYGSKQYICIDASNDELKALLGVDGTEERGTDAQVDFVDNGGKRVGFKDTATIEAQGNRITVTDKDGFKMVYDAAPDSGAIDPVNITVLSAGPLVLQVGNNEGQTFNVNITKTTAESLELSHINIYTHEYANKAIEKIDAAISKISGVRSSLGAYQNRLDYTITNLETANENLTGAVSRIQDTDMAEEITEYTQQNVLSQSALQMLTKSNARPEGLLQLFQR